MDLIYFEDKYIPYDKIVYLELKNNNDDIYIKMVLIDKIILLEYFNNNEEAQKRMVYLLNQLRGVE